MARTVLAEMPCNPVISPYSNWVLKFSRLDVPQHVCNLQRNLSNPGSTCRSHFRDCVMEAVVVENATN